MALGGKVVILSEPINESVQGPGAIPPLTFWVAGTPVQQGSKTAFVVKGKAVMTDQNAKTLKPWRATVTRDAREAAQRHPLFVGPIAVTLEFGMPRGATVRRARPSVTPDLDKLVRAVLDGLTDAGVWGDDGQVVDLHATEFYADEREPGVQITVKGIQ